MKLETIVHDIPPLYDAESRVLLLGSLPSPKSREAHFFYGHPRNRFWPLLAALLGTAVPCTVEEKRHRIQTCTFVQVWGMRFSTVLLRNLFSASWHGWSADFIQPCTPC